MLFASLTLAHSLERSRHLGCTPQDTSFDYFLLALQWPPAYAGFQDKQDWTLHGLWPSRNGKTTASTFPCQCTAQPFDLDSLDDLKPSLEKYWPTLMSSHTNEWLWEHEFEKHGTCSHMRSENEYFRTALDLRGNFDPSLAFSKNSKVRPSLGESYSHADVVEAYAIQYGSEPLLGCKYDKREKKQYLNGIGLCISKELSLENCSAYTEQIRDSENNCWESEPIWFPNPTSGVLAGEL